MTYPFKEPEDLKEQPYSEIVQEQFNMTFPARRVYCQHCRYSVATKLYAPKCGQCKSFLIEFVKSHFNDMATGNS